MSARIPGVYYHTPTKRWYATLKEYNGGKSRGYIGQYATREEAEAARLRAEIAVFGHPLEIPRVVVEDGIAKIPLCGRNRVVRAWTIIDAVDLPLIGDAPWNLVRGYAYSSKATGRPHRYLHRLILPVEGEVDHANGDKLDNRRANLRPATRSQNTWNRRLSRPGASGYRGVYRTSRGGFSAVIYAHRQRIALGNFENPVEGALAYDAAARRLHGEFAVLNFPDDAEAA